MYLWYVSNSFHDGKFHNDVLPFSFGGTLQMYFGIRLHPLRWRIGMLEPRLQGFIRFMKRSRFSKRSADKLAAQLNERQI